jgi:hypothetical protein
VLRVGGRNTLAHRAAYTLVHGKVPDGKLVLHKCHNRACCNVKHLYVGTHADNSSDMVEAGRQCAGSRHWVNKDRAKVLLAARKRVQTKEKNGTSLRGEAISQSKLTRKQVVHIRRLITRDAASQRALARQYGVSHRTIGSIVSGRTWGHVKEGL